MRIEFGKKKKKRKFAPLQLVFSWLLPMLPRNTPLEHLRAPRVCSYGGQLSLLGTAKSPTIFIHLFLRLDWQGFIKFGRNLEINPKLATFGHPAACGPWSREGVRGHGEHSSSSERWSAGDPPAPMVSPAWAQVQATA